MELKERRQKAEGVIMKRFSIVISLMSVATGVALAQKAAAPAGPKVDHCVVSLESVQGEAEVPAQEAGVLVSIGVREGQEVKKTDLLANIDDVLARGQKKAVEGEWQAAAKKAESNIDIRHAEKAAKVAELDFQRSEQASDAVQNAVTYVERMKKKFEWERDLLAKEQAEREKVIAGYTADGKKAELQNADEQIRRREIRTPVDGIVQKIYQHIGEWVKPGDTVIHVVRMDRLSVEGFLNNSELPPAEVMNRPVIVDVELARARKMQFEGKIVFVDPQVMAGGEYVVRAEVENRKEGGQWLLRPGMHVDMTVQLK
jgi:multidrug resistance efflux pump